MWHNVSDVTCVDWLNYKRYHTENVMPLLKHGGGGIMLFFSPVTGVQVNIEEIMDITTYLFATKLQALFRQLKMGWND